MILLDDVNQPHVSGFVSGDRESHGVRRAVVGEMGASASRIAAVTQITLGGFGRLEDFGRTGVAGSMVRIAERKARRRRPGSLIERPQGHEERTCHSGMLTELSSEGSRPDQACRSGWLASREDARKPSSLQA